MEMKHNYGVHERSGRFVADCSCGWEETWYSRNAAQVAAANHGGAELSTGKDYRTRRFVLTTEGMDEMFPGAK